MTMAPRFRLRALHAAVAVTMAMTGSATASAHRVDEYLQAARIGIGPDAVDVYLDVTPGIALAERVVRMIDGDGNGAISAGETLAYAGSVVGNLELALDGEPLALDLVSSEFPVPAEFFAGTGTMRVRAVADVPRLSSGAHTLFFGHMRGGADSAYLANALVPESARIAISRQRRTEDQSELTIDFTLQPTPWEASLGPLAISLAATGLTLFFIRKKPSPGPEGREPCR